jgi:tripartite-type tricarboxylate transporter receptor subunit TctC
VLQSPAYKAQAASVGSELGGESPQEFAAFIRAEMAKWGRLIKDANIKTE